MKYKICKCDCNHVPVIINLHKKLFSHYNGYTDFDSDNTYVASKDCKYNVFGYLNYTESEYERDIYDKIWHINFFGTAPEYQNMGIGSSLLKQYISDSKRLGIDLLSLYVRTDNAVARNLYEKFGFVEAGFGGTYSDGHPGIRYEHLNKIKQKKK